VESSIVALSLTIKSAITGNNVEMVKYIHIDDIVYNHTCMIKGTSRGHHLEFSLTTIY